MIPRQPIIGLAGVIVICVATGNVWAGVPATMPRAALEDQLLHDAADGRLDSFSLLDASLIASGVSDPQQLAEFADRFERHCARFRSQHPYLVTQLDQTNCRALASAVMTYLHRDILTATYQIESTRVDEALRTGHYNCVASTILFRCLSAELGATPEIVATPSHVFCRYPLGNDLVVETTCPQWFDVPVDSELISVHPAHRSDAQLRSLTDVQVLGKLFYNRATDRLDSNDFAAACRLLRVSLALDAADRSARENLLATLNNWSLQLCDTGQFAAAAELLTEGGRLHPGYGPFQVNDLHVHQQWALDLCRREQFADALELLERCHRRRPDVDLFDQGRLVVYGMWAGHLFRLGCDDEGLQRLDQARRRFSDRADVRQYESDSILQAVRWRLDQGQAAAARTLLESGLARQPDNPRLKSQAQKLTNA